MKILINNRKARFEYEILDVLIAGLKLVGTEVKSLRENKASIGESFCYFKDGELYVKNMHIAEWSHGNINNHDPLRERKLLLTKIELEKLEEKISQKGLTIVPLDIHLTKSGLMKMKIALVKGKKLWDKREAIKEKDLEREAKRNE